MNLTNASYCSESFCCRIWSYSSLTLSVRSLHMRSQMMVICLRVNTGFSFVPTNARALKPLLLGLLPESGEPETYGIAKFNPRFKKRMNNRFATFHNLQEGHNCKSITSQNSLILLKIDLPAQFWLNCTFSLYSRKSVVGRLFLARPVFLVMKKIVSKYLFF